MSTRRVRRVRLAAPHPDLVRRGAVLLEDALHTASIPGGDGGRLVLVRRLDVGRISPRAAPATLALAIERRLREVEWTAVHAEDASASSASAVFFRDGAEACALLAVRLASGAAVDGWFWPSAVPGWRVGMDAEEGIRLALRAAASSPPGAAAVAEVLRIAAARGVADRILLTLVPATAAELARSHGWTASSAAGEGRAEAVPAAWRRLLERWIGTWGADDVRSRWLAATVLVAERPSRAADRTLQIRAAALVRAVLTTSPTIRPRDDAAPQLPPVIPRLEGEAEPAALHPPRVVDPSPGTGLPRPPHPADAATPADGVDARSAPRGNEASMNPSIPNPDRRIGDITSKADERVAEAVGRDASPPHPPASVEARAERRAADGDHPPRDPPAGVEGPARRRERTDADAPEPTEAGGLFFLVAAMERLGMREVLDRHPALLEADLPGRVLLRVAGRTRVPADDPAVLSLADARDAGETGVRYAFQAPDVWSKLSLGPGAPDPRAEAVAPSERVISPRRAARAAGPDRPRAEGEGAEAGRGSSADAGGADLERIVEAWVTALRRWCRRHARMGLWTLVRRPGRMRFTRTHVDVMLRLKSADVRIRAAGLDVDPGWVSWMGRVIAFHYVD